MTDNATVFCSEEFREFLRHNNVQSVTSPPYHPASNGAAENAVKTVINALKNSLHKNQQYGLNKALNNFPFEYRNVPHCSTGKCPAELMFSRKLRTSYDTLLPNNSYVNDELKKHMLNQQRKQASHYRGNRFV